MEIIQNFTLEEIAQIEHMISLRYKMPYVPFNDIKLSRKILYVITPVLYVLSIMIYMIDNIPVFIFCMSVAIISTVFILWYLLIGAKQEKNIHEMLQERLENQHKVYIDKYKIIHKDIEYTYEEVRYVIYLESYVFIFLNEPKYLLIKANNSEREYIKEILSNYKKIIQEEKNKLFNVYVYLNKAVDKPM